MKFSIRRRTTTTSDVLQDNLDMYWNGDGGQKLSIAFCPRRIQLHLNDLCDPGESEKSTSDVQA